MRARSLLRRVLAAALVALAIFLTLVFLAVPVNRYDFMRDFGETQLPEDGESTMRFAILFVPWLVSAAALRWAGWRAGAIAALVAGIVFACFGVARQAGLLG